jgi:1,4-dihydroxy-6-naphthoate synthase
MVIAVPGKLTTGYALLELLYGPLKRIITLPYNQIIDAICSGRCDAGVLIHESRFTFPERGLQEIVDLGARYVERYRYPVPLGVFVASRLLGSEKIDAITKALQSSLEYSKNHFLEIMPELQKFAMEKDSRLIADFLDLYVSPETLTLSAAGYEAIEAFFWECIDKKLTPRTSLKLLP